MHFLDCGCSRCSRPRKMVLRDYPYPSGIASFHFFSVWFASTLLSWGNVSACPAPSPVKSVRSVSWYVRRILPIAVLQTLNVATRQAMYQWDARSMKLRAFHSNKRNTFTFGKRPGWMDLENRVPACSIYCLFNTG